ncbi:MAG: TolC family protein, partial [Deltaproteobacteria bacterium]|nr:TolC family protein [Deltaproteobacteria bacterium]
MMKRPGVRATAIRKKPKWSLSLSLLLVSLFLLFPVGSASADPGRAEAVAPSTPNEVIEEVRSRNPGLSALGASVEAAGHTAPQAGSMPDPTLTVGLSNYPFSTSQTPMSGVQFDLRQRLVWFKKLDAMEAAAKQDQRIQQSLRVEKRNTLVARAWSLLWELTYLKEEKRLALEIGSTLRYFEDVTKAAYSVGRGRQQDLIKPVVAHQRIDETVVGIDRQAGIVLSELNRLRDRDPGAAVIPPAMPKAGPPDLPRSVLLDYARRHNPLVDLRENRINRQREMLTAAREDYVPDFTVGLQYRARWI